MKRSRVTSLVLVGILGLAGCADVDSPVEVRLDGPDFARTATPWQYMVSAGGSLPDGFAATVARNGDELVHLNAEAGFALLRTTNPGAYAAAGAVIPDFDLDWIDEPRPPVALVDAAANPRTSGDDDFFFDLQWGHDAVNAPEAWAASSRGAGVLVAVLDDGIDSDHGDLAPNFRADLSTSFVPGETYEYIENFPGDPFSHGTHVAGTVVAADNGFGTIGIAPEAEFFMVKVLSSLTGRGSFGGVIAGILYAAEQGADVINMSLGATLPRRGIFIDPGTPDDRSDDVHVRTANLLAAISRATTWATQQGSTVIAALGNSARDLDRSADLVFVPAMSTNVIAISATGPHGWGLNPATDLDRLAFYSNFGRSAVEFAAPGGNVDFDLRAAGDVCTVTFVVRPCWVFDLVFSTGSAGRWYWSAGTSMASPHAAGIAALIIGENGGSMHPAQVRTEMKRRAEDLGQPGQDPFYGAGRVHAGH